MKNRILWVDQIKAIAMLFVILGHMPINDVFKSWIYSFHMPIFFFITGFTLNLDKIYKTSLKDYCIKQGKHLLIPYLYISFLCLIPHYWMAYYKGNPLNLKLLLKGIVISNSDLYCAPSNPSWFIVSLFLALVLLAIIVKVTKNKEILIMAIISLLLPISLETPKEFYPWHVNVLPIILLYLMIGHFLRKIYDLYRENLDRTYFAIILILSFFGFFLGYLTWKYNGRVSVAANFYGNDFLLSLISAVFTSAGFVFLFIKCKEIKVLSFIGKNTFFYMGFHKAVILIAQTRFPEYSSNMKFICLIAAFIMCVFLPLIWFAGIYTPYIVGKSLSSHSIWTELCKYAVIIACGCVIYVEAMNRIGVFSAGNSFFIKIVAWLIYIVLCGLLFVISNRYLKFVYLED